jgi:hypothetical protein
MVARGIGGANVQVTSALFQIGVSLLIAVTTAWVTVWLSLRRFYREKWWEAKMRSYTDVIQALHNMKRDLEISIQAEQRGQDTETDYHKEWGAKHRVAWDEIRKQIDVGEFLFSSESLQILESLNAETKAHYETYYDHLEAFQAAVEKCLPEIKSAARRDLGLPRIKRL